MNQIRYAQLCQRFQDAEVDFTVTFLELTTMLGAIRLMQDHPDFQALGPVKELTQGIRTALLGAMLDMGVSPKDVHAMNVLYSSQDGGVTFQPRGPEDRPDGEPKIITMPTASDGDEE